MDELKQKFKNIIHKQENVRIPTMGFSEYYFQNVSLIPGTYQQQSASNKTENVEENEENQQYPLNTRTNLSDQEILESTEDIYFNENVDTGIYEMKKLTTTTEFDCKAIESSIFELKQQHKVISKKVLQLILEQRTPCLLEFNEICETEKKLKESLSICQDARFCLKSAKKQLTTTSLEILATYKKREILLNLLKILKILRKMKTTDQELQIQLERGNYSGAISILLENKQESEKLNEFHCVDSLTLKLQDTLIITEVQLDNVLNEIPLNFDLKKYSKLQEAYQLLGKTSNAMDQLHMNYISAVHTTAFSGLKEYVDLNFDEQKLLFEQLCEKIPTERYISCLINLCKAFWRILVSYHHVILWHNNHNLTQNLKTSNQNEATSSSISCEQTKMDSAEFMINEKLKRCQYRLWNDIQSKICIFLANSKLNQLKYDNFIQVLSIIQRLKKVGYEFCEDNSEKLMSSIRSLSMDFFQRYHISCLEEVNLFLDHEIWIQIDSFTKVTQLQEFRTVKRTLKRHKIGPDSGDRKSITPCKKYNNDNDSSTHSQDESSIFGSCGYFLRFCEKSSPFDGGFDESMLEEDILAGIADESSCYYSDDSDNDSNEEYSGNNNVVIEKSEIIYVSNTSLTVLRCIGRYLQMCRLLHSIAPFIVASMTELIDFYIFAVNEMFGKDLPVSSENLYTNILTKHLQRISTEIIPKVRKWPPSMMILTDELQNSEQLYGLTKRLIGVESCISLINQFEQLRGYLDYLLPGKMEKQILHSYFSDTKVFVCDLRKPIYMCVTARIIDIPNILASMAKTKWDINHVTVEYSPYINVINRGIQMFAMRLEEISKTNVMIPKEPLWDCLAHIVTHMLVEGFSNAKKCTYGGRTLMQLDFTHFISILELISGSKHQKHKDYVDQYVKAYYLPKDLLENWIIEHKQKQIYSNKHLSGLVQCACSNDKKLRQRLLGIIDGTTINFQSLNSVDN